MDHSKTSGFTLVELMVVVAMVGIFAAIAIPQYSKFVAKARQAEAKVNLAAAYTALQSFAAENGSYSLCLRQVGYVPDGPVNNCGPARYYAIGFDERMYVDHNNCGPAGNQPCAYKTFAVAVNAACDGASPAFPCCSGGWLNYDGLNPCGGYPLDQSDMQYGANRGQAVLSGHTLLPSHGHFWQVSDGGVGTSIDANHFTLGAVGNISSSSASSSSCLDSGSGFRATDGWTINETKTLINTNVCL